MKTELEIAHEKMKAWNERRANAEKKGIEKFWKLHELFKEEKELKKLLIKQA